MKSRPHAPRLTRMPWGGPYPGLAFREMTDRLLREVGADRSLPMNVRRAAWAEAGFRFARTLPGAEALHREFPR